MESWNESIQEELEELKAAETARVLPKPLSNAEVKKPPVIKQQTGRKRRDWGPISPGLLDIFPSIFVF